MQIEVRLPCPELLKATHYECKQCGGAGWVYTYVRLRPAVLMTQMQTPQSCYVITERDLLEDLAAAGVAMRSPITGALQTPHQPDFGD